MNKTDNFSFFPRMSDTTQLQSSVLGSCLGLRFGRFGSECSKIKMERESTMYKDFFIFNFLFKVLQHRQFLVYYYTLLILAKGHIFISIFCERIGHIFQTVSK